MTIGEVDGEGRTKERAVEEDSSLTTAMLFMKRVAQHIYELP